MTSNLGIYGGKPIVAGTRIPGSVVLNLLGHGSDVAGVVAAHPDPTAEDVRAALSVAERNLPGAIPQPVADAV